MQRLNFLLFFAFLISDSCNSQSSTQSSDRFRYSQTVVIPHDQNRPVFTLPAPSATFSVGRYWTSVRDASRNDREIPIFIYYPTKSSSVSFIIPTEEWRKEYTPVLQKRLGEQAAVDISQARATLSEDGPVSLKSNLPLILFSPGMNWSSLEYSFIIQELVSAGYIVVAVNSSPATPVLQSPGKKFLTYERPKDIYQLVSDDISFVLHEIVINKGKLCKALEYADLKNVGIAGHSLGGAAALLAASNSKDVDPKTTTVNAAVNMDGDLMEASQHATPASSVLFLNQLPASIANMRFPEMIADASVGWRYGLMAKAASKAKTGKYISIAGMYHSNFQDYSMLPPATIPENIRKTRLGPIDGTLCLKLISRILVTYFDEQLKNKSADWGKLQQQQDAIRVIDIKNQ